MLLFYFKDVVKMKSVRAFSEIPLPGEAFSNFSVSKKIAAVFLFDFKSAVTT